MCRAAEADDAQVGPVIASAAGVGDSNLAAWALLGILLWTGWYLIACALYPWRACTRCDGGKKRSSSRRNWRDCRHCAGSGRRHRIGRRVWGALSRSARK